MDCFIHPMPCFGAADKEGPASALTGPVVVRRRNLGRKPTTGGGVAAGFQTWGGGLVVVSPFAMFCEIETFAFGIGFGAEAQQLVECEEEDG